MASYTPKTALNSDVKLKTLQKTFEEQAQAGGLLDDYLFVQHYKAYCDQLSMMDQLKDQVARLGIMIIVPVGKDGQKQVVNPAVAEYNRTATLAGKTAATILTMIDRHTKAVDDEPIML